MQNELVEELAKVEHARWAHWQKYVHTQCEQLEDGRLAIPAHLVERWERQIETPYEQLSDEEKKSDREQVAKVLPVIGRFFELEL